MNRRRWIALVIVIAIAAAGAAVWFFGSRRREKPLVLSGAIEARDVEVGSLVGGRVARVLVEEGSRVAAGQPIVQFQTDLIDLQVAQQNSRVEEMRANLVKALRGPRVEEVERARAEAVNTERERLRQ